MTDFQAERHHTTTAILPLGKGEVHSSILCGSTTRKALIIKAFFKRNTIDRLPYGKTVGLNFGRSAILLVLAVGACAPADRYAAAREEYKARPACVNRADDTAWTQCMEKFKDVRPVHPPTTLQFKDWRT